MQEQQNQYSPQIRVTEHKSNTNVIQFSKRKFRMIAPLLGVVIIAIVGLLIYSQLQIKALKKGAQSSNSSGQATLDDSKQLLDEVSKFVVLPTGEDPTIATVNDLSKLKDQAFFDNAKVGDKVLIYSKAQKAILYRPSENKLIEFAPLSSEPATTPPQPKP